MLKINLCLVLLSTLIMPSCAKSPEAPDEGGYQLNPTVDESAPNGIYIPKNLDDAHEELKKMLPKDLITKMKNGTEDDMVQYHMGLGGWFRNNWGLWGGSRLSKYFNSLGIYHPDDMSGIILRTFWCHLSGEPQRLSEKISYYKEYWKSVEASKETSPNDVTQ